MTQKENVNFDWRKSSFLVMWIASFVTGAKQLPSNSEVVEKMKEFSINISGLHLNQYVLWFIRRVVGDMAWFLRRMEKTNGRDSLFFAVQDAFVNFLVKIIPQYTLNSEMRVLEELLTLSYEKNMDSKFADMRQELCLKVLEEATVKTQMVG